MKQSFWCRTLGDLALYADRADARPLMNAGKPLGILVYVGLAAGRRASRDHVAELFWPGCPSSDARHSLRQSLYRLRQMSGAPLVRIRGLELEVSPLVEFDCVEGERLATQGDRNRAHELLRGNFLEGFSGPESAEFESWADCDSTCLSLFWKAPFAFEKARAWAKRGPEIQRRAGFALMAALAVHDKGAQDRQFLRFLPLLEAAATDERNLIKKAVNWSIRQVGKRNGRLNREAVHAAHRIAKLPSPSARWIASDALRELESPQVKARLKKRG